LYWQEQERLAVERLHQTHDTLRAYKLRGPVEEILGNVEPGVLNEEAGLAAERPAWVTASNTGEVGMAGLVRPGVLLKPCWLADRMVTAEPGPIEVLLQPRREFERVIFGRSAGSPRYAGAIALPRFAMVEIAPRILAPGVAPTAMLVGAFRLVEWTPSPVTIELQDVQAPAPLSETLYLLPRFAAVAPGVYATQNEIEPLTVAFRVQLPLSAELDWKKTFAIGDLVRLGLPQAGLRELPLDRLTPASWVDAIRGLDLQAALEGPLQTPPLRPRLKLAAGRRYAVESLEAAPTKGDAPAHVETLNFHVTLPQLNVGAAPAEVPVQPEFEPAPSGLLRLDCHAQAAESREVRPAAGVLSAPQPPRPNVLHPVARFEPASLDFMSMPPMRGMESPEPVPNDARAHVRAHLEAFGHVADFWKRAPRDLRLLAFAIPVLLALALHPGLPKVRVAAPAGGIGRNIETAVNTQFANLKQTVFERAAIALDEDFRSGLDDWASRGDATTDWSFDSTGFVRPGPLALYRPSIGLTDYQLQFLGMIDKKALSWVVRASDFDNYYVVKLMVLKPGPVPTLGVTRYAVVNGKADSRSDVIARIDARNDMLYRVRMDVHGDDFALSIQGQMIDAWSEPRLARGGVGFFTAQGEESRLRWVQVTHQYDMLGRLCAYLVPYNNLTAYNNAPASGNLQP
jgi:hypothetical protein